jgi:hypothetical protein
MGKDLIFGTNSVEAIESWCSVLQSQSLGVWRSCSDRSPVSVFRGHQLWYGIRVRETCRCGTHRVSTSEQKKKQSCRSNALQSLQRTERVTHWHQWGANCCCLGEQSPARDLLFVVVLIALCMRQWWRRSSQALFGCVVFRHWHVANPCCASPISHFFPHRDAALDCVRFFGVGASDGTSHISLCGKRFACQSRRSIGPCVGYCTAGSCRIQRGERVRPHGDCGPMSRLMGGGG